MSPEATITHHENSVGTIRDLWIMCHDYATFASSCELSQKARYSVRILRIKCPSWLICQNDGVRSRKRSGNGYPLLLAT